MKQQPFYQSTAKFIAAILIVMLALAALPVTPAHAAAKSWVPTTGGDWTVGTNWSGSVAPVAGDDVTIPADQSAAITAVPAISLTSLTISGDTILQGAGTLTVTGALTVDPTKSLSLGFTTSVGDLQGSGNITNSAAVTLTINNTGSTTYSGALLNGTGTLSLTKSGAGTLTLSGTSTYTGLTTISAGTLKLGAAGSGANGPLGTIGSGTTVTAGAALDLNGFTLTTAEALTLNGTGISSGGALTNSSATAASYSGLITLGSDSSIVTNAGDINVTNTGTITGAILGLTLGGSGNGSLASILVTTSGTLTKSGTGTWTLSGASTYTGLTTISAGTLKLGAAGSGANTPLGTIGSGTIVTAAGAVLDLNGFTLTTAEALTLNGTGISSDGALTNSSATAASYSGLITLGSDSSIVTNAGAINVTNTGTITGPTLGLTLGGSGNGSLASILGTTSGTLTKSGAGTWTLSGASTYTGLTTISAGTLKLGAAGSGANTPLGTIGSGTTVTATGAELDLNGFTLTTAEALTLNGTGISSSGALTNTSATAASYSGLITLGSASSIVTNAGDINVSNTGTITGDTFGLTLGGTGNGSLASILGTTTGTLTKSGTGTWTLSGASTYTGLTTISAGTLKLGAAGSGANTPLGTIGSGTIVTAAGAVLDLNGFTLTTAEALTLNGTGISSGGALTNTSATAASYSGLITLGSDSSIVTNAGAINVTNTGTITGATFGLTLGGSGNGSLASILGTTTGTLTKSGTGTWTLSGANTFTGGTTLSAGTLNINNLQALGTVDGTFIINGGTIDNTSGADITTLNYPQNWNGDFIFTGAKNLNLGTGAVTMNANRQVTVSAGTLTVGGGVLPGTFNLTKAGTGTLSFGANTVTLNALIINAGTLTATSGTMYLGGNFTNNGTLTNNSGTVIFSGPGPAAQTIGGSTATTFNNLTINNSNGITLGAYETVNGILTFTSGKITTGTNNLILPTAATVSGAGTDRYVFGNVQRAFTGAASFTFPIGDATNYAPVLLSFTGGGTSGNVTAAVTGVACGSPGIDPSKNVNHCWTLTNGVTDFTNYSATFNFVGVGTDADTGATTGNFIVGRLDSATWSYPTVGTKTGTSTQATGMTSMSSFEVGEPGGAITTTVGDGTAPASKFVKALDTNKAVSAFTLATSASTDTVTGLVVTGSGTGLANVAASGVKLWRDNGSVPNEWDATDTAVGSGVSFFGSAATFSGLSIPVTTTATQYLITYEIIASPTNAQTMLGAVTGVTATNTVTNNDTTDATLTVDSIAPTISISAPSALTTTVGPVTYTVTYVDTNFNSSTLAVGNITLNKTGSADGTIGVTGLGLTPTVTISSITGYGTLGISIAAGTASDLAGNLAPAAGPSDTFTLNNPVPTTTGLIPSSKAAGGAGFTLTVIGTHFVNGSTVRWNGSNRTTTYVNDTQLTASILAADIATGSTIHVTVFNGTPEGGTSNVQNFTINNPVPTTTSLSPTSKTAGGAAFILTVNGTHFVTGSKVRWNGSNRTTTYVSSTQLTASIPAANIAAAGTASVTVFNGTPGGGTSNAQTFTIKALFKKTYQSTGSYDGWVLESSETSGVGGTKDANGPTFYLGDDASNRQYRSILSFDTTSLPDNAVITKVTLKIKYQGRVGTTNPFTTHGDILVDVKKGAFSNNNALQAADFQALASKTAAGTITNTPASGWYPVSFGSNTFTYVNKTGPTQFRLRFQLDDNNDHGADFLKFYSGNYFFSSYRPVLLIEYTVP
jgi:autotransporter-associated beta strand protein